MNVPKLQSGPTPPSRAVPRKPAETGPPDRFEASGETFRKLAPPGLKPMDTPPVEEPRAEEPASPPPGLKTGHKLAAGVALALTGIGTLAGMAQPAMAQEVQVAPVHVQQGQSASVQRLVQTSQSGRVTEAQRYATTRDVVQNFRGDRALYVVGNPEYQGRPLADADYQRYSSMLRDYPNAYVVLIDRTTNLPADDLLLGKGIGESTAFQTRVTPETGEQDGVIFFVYFNVNNDPGNRKIFMRAESLPDRLGVGEQDFAEPGTGNPRRLLSMYVDNVRNKGQHPAQALGGVVGYINDTVKRAISDAAGVIDQGNQLLPRVQNDVRNFQAKHGGGGSFGTPPVGQWLEDLHRAETLYQQRDLGNASRVANEVIQAARAQQELMQRYEQAPAQATQLESQLKQLDQQLATLPNNSEAAAARLALQNAHSQLASYNTSYEAKDRAFWDNLQAANSSATRAGSQAQASRSAEERSKNIRILGASVGALAVVATGVTMNLLRRKKKHEAEAELAKAQADVRERSGKLLEFLKTADYGTLAGYEGKTKDASQAVIDSVADALTLAGGGEKFLAEAEGLIQGRGWNTVKNLFLAGNFEKAVALLTDPEQKLSYDLRDSQKVQADHPWIQSLLAAGRTPSFELSLAESMARLSGRTETSQAGFADLEKKRTEIDTYLATLETRSTGLHRDADRLKESAPDGRFAVPALLGQLLPAVEGEKGLLAGGKAQAHHDFVSAWDDFAVKAERVIGDGKSIVESGAAARETLLPKLDGSDAILQPHGRKTEWAHEEGRKLADRLDLAASRASSASVAEQVKAVNLDVARLETRIDTVVAQDKERLEVGPPLIAEANRVIEDGRQTMTSDMQQMGYYKSGTSANLLREDGRDPSQRTKEAQSHLDLVAGNLDLGDVEKGAVNLQAVHDLTGEAHTLVENAHDTVSHFQPTLRERRERNQGIDASIAKTYQPSLERIAAGYEAEVMQLIAPEVGAGPTLADNVQQAHQLLGGAAQQTDKAEDDFNWGRVLATRDGFVTSDQTLREAQANLDGVTGAEASLAGKQKGAETDLDKLQGRVNVTDQATRAEYVRRKAKDLLSETQQKLAESGRIVGAEKKNPFAAQKALAVAENLRGQVDGAIAGDKRAYDAALAEIREAESDLRSAESHVSSCANQSWHYSSAYGYASESVTSSDLSSAHGSLRSASSEIDQARRLVQQQEYEKAKSVAQSSESESSQAKREGDAAVSRAHSRFESEVAAIKWREHQAEEQSHHNGGGGGGGHHGGGGGSGTTGGNW